MRRLRLLLLAACAFVVLAVPAEAGAAELTLGPRCIKSSEQVVRAHLAGSFAPFDEPDVGFTFYANGPNGEGIRDATYSDLSYAYQDGYYFNIHLPSGLAPGNYTMTAGGSPPAAFDSEILKVSPSCDSILMGNADTPHPVYGMSSMPGDTKSVSPFVIFRSATVRKIGVYIAGQSGGVSQRVRGVIYSHAQARPSALIGQTFELNMRGSTAANWVELYMAPPLRVNPGFYWIGADAPAQKTYFGTPPVVEYGWNTKASSRRNNADSYANGPSAAFGDSLLDDKQMSIYASGSY